MIIDSPIISGSYAASGSLNQFGNVVISGSLTVTGSIIGSSSYALTASYATNAGAGAGFPFSGSAQITGSLLITELSGSGVRYLTTDNTGLIVAQTASAAIKTTQAVTSTAGQTSFNITNGYTTGLVDVFINGTKLSASEFTDTSGTVITLATGSNSGDTVEFVKYFPASGVTNNALRQLTQFTATAGQTVFSASYTPGLLDIYYNGSRLSTSDYTANNGTYFTLATASAANDILDVLVYSYQVGGFSGIGGTGSAAQVAYFSTGNAITGSPNFTINDSTMTVTGSLLVSGSGTFTNIGPAVMSGSLNVSGAIVTNSTITAQTLVVQTITSSVSVMTGSTNFGSLVSNTHTFTGSLNVTGSLSVVTTGTEFQVNSTGVNLGNALTDSHIISGSLRVNPNGLFVSSSGNVGIGTTTTSGRLDVQASGTSAFSYYFRNSSGGYGGGVYNTGTNHTQLYLATSAGTENILLNSTGSSYFNGGNVGIGNSNPFSPLHINSNGAFSTSGNMTSGFIISNTNFGRGINIGVFDASAYAYIQAAYVNNADTTFALALQPRGGNVGIGTISPQAELDVVDPSYNQYTLRVQSSAGNNANGWGGIGFSGEGANTKAGIFFVSDGGSYSRGSLVFATNNDFNQNNATPSNQRLRIQSDGIVYVLNSGVDGTYQPMIGGMYTGNNNETNLISTAVSSAANQSGFRFDVSNGAGSSGRTTSMTINRSSVTIVGALSKGSGSFRIKHPLASKKDTYQLVHSFIEGPQADLIYRGKVRLVEGRVEVNIDEASGMTEGTFEALCREVQCFTTNETGWDAVRGKVIGNILTIESQNAESTDEISWMVVGERQDEHMFDTEWTDENGKVIVEPLIIE